MLIALQVQQIVRDGEATSGLNLAEESPEILSHVNLPIGVDEKKSGTDPQNDAGVGCPVDTVTGPEGVIAVIKLEEEASPQDPLLQDNRAMAKSNSQLRSECIRLNKHIAQLEAQKSVETSQVINL